MTVKYVTDLLKNPRRIILSPWRRASRSLRDTGWQSPVVDHETKHTGLYLLQEGWSLQMQDPEEGCITLPTLTVL